MRYLFAILILLDTLSGFPARAAHTEAELILGADPVAPGATVLAGVRAFLERYGVVEPKPVQVPARRVIPLVPAPVDSSSPM